MTNKIDETDGNTVGGFLVLVGTLIGTIGSMLMLLSVLVVLGLIDAFIIFGVGGLVGTCFVVATGIALLVGALVIAGAIRLKYVERHDPVNIASRSIDKEKKAARNAAKAARKGPLMRYLTQDVRPRKAH